MTIAWVTVGATVPAEYVSVDGRPVVERQARRLCISVARADVATADQSLTSGLAAEPGGVIVYRHVDDVTATLERLVLLGARQLEAVTERCPGFVRASVVDRTATSWALCTTATTSISWPIAGSVVGDPP